jgi:hypothetical protein|tara:strand:+ start:1457 stop:1570 length:114 start_codon:yes stop_codon:yes gene_type:complete
MVGGDVRTRQRRVRVRGMRTSGFINLKVRRREGATAR